MLFLKKHFLVPADSADPLTHLHAAKLSYNPTSIPEQQHFGGIDMWTASVMKGMLT